MYISGNKGGFQIHNAQMLAHAVGTQRKETDTCNAAEKTVSGELYPVTGRYNATWIMSVTPSR